MEIAACGTLGKNYNQTMFIRGDTKFLDRKILNRKFIGFGVGLERLIYLYS